MPGEKTEQADSAPSQQKCQNHRRNYYRRPSRVYIFLLFSSCNKEKKTHISKRYVVRNSVRVCKISCQSLHHSAKVFMSTYLLVT